MPDTGQSVILQAEADLQLPGPLFCDECRREASGVRFDVETILFEFGLQKSTRAKLLKADFRVRVDLVAYLYGPVG